MEVQIDRQPVDDAPVIVEEEITPEETHPEAQEKESTSMSLRAFLLEFGDVLKAKVQDGMRPRFDPFNMDGKDKARSERLEHLKRMLKPGQVPPVLALAKGYLEGDMRGLILCGEMGTGKTQMALAVAYLLGAKRTLIMCPGHLVHKWIREAQEVIPGVKTVNLNDRSLEDLIALKTGNQISPTELFEPEDGAQEVWVLGKERAKLHYKTEQVFRRRKIQGADRVCCPTCMLPIDSDYNKYEKIKRQPKPVCPNCGEMMYQAMQAHRRIAKADFIQRYLKGVFSLVVGDEIHELKGGTTGQGQAFADLAASCDRTLALTGTLMGGYSTNLYYLLWRIMPREMKVQAMKFGMEMTFAGRYGILERTYVTEDDYNQVAIGGRKGRLVRTSEKPGISPLLLTDFLLPYTVFVRLSDIAESLPPYAERVVSVPMQETQRMEYLTYEAHLIEEVKEALKRGDKRLLGKMIQSLLAYPDGCTTRGEVITLDFDEQPVVIATAPQIAGIELPKIKEMLDVIGREIDQGRKVLLCLEHTGTRDLVPGLVEEVEKAGFKTPLILRADTVNAEHREEWLMEKSKEADFDILITNPKLVMTGLDLIDYPSIYFYQCGYSIFVLRQASRRSWRIGQKEPVRVYFSAYRETVQEKALKLIASKLETALAVEGDLSDKGLTALANSDSSMIFALARKLVDGSADSRSVEDLWAGYTSTQSKTDQYIGAPEPVTVNSVINETQVSVTYVPVYRGRIHRKTWRIGKTYTPVGVCMLDDKWQITFKDGEITWKGLKVGSYYREGNLVKGDLHGKSIQLYKPKNGDHVDLYEFRPKEGDQKAA